MIIENGAEVSAPEQNTIIGSEIELSKMSKITFKGRGNILFAEPDVRLSKSEISFLGDNAVLYLSTNTKHSYMLKLDLWRETSTFFGRDSYFNGVFSAVVSERQNLLVGDDGVFSFGIWLRTADPHLIYDAATGRRTNMSKSILIGDHVWIGQNALILKGSRLGSGSILSAAAVLAGKAVPSNSVFAGNPAKEVKTGIFHIGKSVHNYTRKKTDESMTCDTKEYIYKDASKASDVEMVFGKLTGAKDAEERLEIIKQNIASCSEKNRFCISEPKRKTGLFGKKLNRLL